MIDLDLDTLPPKRLLFIIGRKCGGFKFYFLLIGIIKVVPEMSLSGLSRLFSFAIRLYIYGSLQKSLASDHRVSPYFTV